MLTPPPVLPPVTGLAQELLSLEAVGVCAWLPPPPAVKYDV